MVLSLVAFMFCFLGSSLAGPAQHLVQASVLVVYLLLKSEVFRVLSCVAYGVWTLCWLLGAGAVPWEISACCFFCSFQMVLFLAVDHFLKWPSDKYSALGRTRQLSLLWFSTLRTVATNGLLGLPSPSLPPRKTLLLCWNTVPCSSAWKWHKMGLFK